jgi:hypothetical protein
MARKKIPPKLLQRRKPAKDWDDRYGLYLITGKELTADQLDREAFVELIASREHYDQGLELIAKHYGIAAPVPKSVIISTVLITLTPVHVLAAAWTLR